MTNRLSEIEIREAWKKMPPRFWSDDEVFDGCDIDPLDVWDAPTVAAFIGADETWSLGERTVNAREFARVARAVSLVDLGDPERGYEMFGNVREAERVRRMNDPYGFCWDLIDLAAMDCSDAGFLLVKLASERLAQMVVDQTA